MPSTLARWKKDVEESKRRRRGRAGAGRRDKVYRPTNDTDFAPTKISRSRGIRYREHLVVSYSFSPRCVAAVGFARF